MEKDNNMRAIENIKDMVSYNAWGNSTSPRRTLERDVAIRQGRRGAGARGHYPWWRAPFKQRSWRSTTRGHGRGVWLGMHEHGTPRIHGDGSMRRHWA